MSDQQINIETRLSNLDRKFRALLPRYVETSLTLFRENLLRKKTGFNSEPLEILEQKLDEIERTFACKKLMQDIQHNIACQTTKAKMLHHCFSYHESMRVEQAYALKKYGHAASPQMTTIKAIRPDVKYKPCPQLHLQYESGQEQITLGWSNNDGKQQKRGAFHRPKRSKMAVW
jgi:hypothetical protein